MKNSVICNL